MTMGMEQRKVVDGYVFQFRNKLTDAADDGDSIAWTVGTVTRTDGGVVDIDDAVSTLNLQDYYVDDFGGISPNDVDWGHVGTVAEMAEQLRNVCIMVGVLDEAQVPA